MGHTCGCYHARLTMLKRTLYPLILAFALLFTQQAALWHGVSHTGSATSSQQDQHLPHAEQCAKCLSFAHIDAAATATPHACAVPQRVQALVYLHVSAAHAAQHPPYQSRAPPRFA